MADKYNGRLIRAKVKGLETHGKAVIVTVLGEAALARGAAGADAEVTEVIVVLFGICRQRKAGIFTASSENKLKKQY